MKLLIPEMRERLHAKTLFIVVCTATLQSQLQAQLLGADTVGDSIKRLDWPNHHGALATSIKGAVQSVGLLNGVQFPGTRLHEAAIQVKGLFYLTPSSPYRCRRKL